MYGILCDGAFYYSLLIFSSRDYIRIVFYSFPFIFSTTINAYIKSVLPHTTIVRLRNL